MTYNDPCYLHETGVCITYRPGHQIHAIQARLLGERPEQWRDGIITSVNGQMATIAYLNDRPTPTLWHHRDFARRPMHAP